MALPAGSATAGSHRRAVRRARRLLEKAADAIRSPVVIPVVLWALALVILVATFLPMWSSDAWWIRILDFPRLQIAVLAALVLLAAAVVPGPGRWLIVALMGVACGYQVWRIFPYTPLAASEMKLAAHGPGEVRVLSSNVLMENRRHDLLLAVIAEFDPDILLLMETDQTWIDALEPALARYPTVLREPGDDHYGMVFATRLEVVEVRIVRLTTSDTPSVFAELRDRQGTAFRFVGLHPRPPVPGQSTRQRDAQIHYAARFAAKSGVPLVVMGDFNDVAWSDTSRTFKHAGRYLDPRVGRGFYASFDAKRRFLRFPIDQLFVTPDIAVVAIERRGHVGSDHFPMAATIRVDADLAAGLNREPPPLSARELKILDDSVARTREMLAEAHR